MDELALQHAVLGDVFERQHGPDHSSLFVKRRAVIFNGVAGAILLPEDVIRGKMRNPFLDRFADRALARVKRDPFRIGMPQQLMLMASLNLLQRPAGDLLRGGIEEHGLPLLVDNPDGFGGGIQDQFASAGEAVDVFGSVMDQAQSLVEQPPHERAHDKDRQERHHARQSEEVVSRHGSIDGERGDALRDEDQGHGNPADRHELPRQTRGLLIGGDGPHGGRKFSNARGYERGSYVGDESHG